MTDIFNKQLDKINTNQFTAAVIGLGYIGLPLLLRFAENGCNAIGIDIDPAKVESLSNKNSYIKHIPSERISAVHQLLSFSTDFRELRNADVIVICVPTPLNQYREPDLSFVINTVEQIFPHLQPGHIISLESTTYPGTTEEELLPRLQADGLKVGKDVFLIYSPEREDPGNQNFTTRTIPKIVSGHTQNCLELAKALYAKVCDQIVPVSSTKVAEMTKLLENIHRAVNIGLVNEMKVLADKMGINIYEVIDAAKTKPFGFTAYYPGPGLGGHCIPIDPFYLTWKAREYGVHTRFIELAGEVNNAMPDYVVEKVMLGLNQQQKSLSSSKILVLGIAYKKNVDDMRESPAVVIMDKLTKLGAQVDYSDPFIPVFPKIRNYSFDMNSVDLTVENVTDYDCVIIATDHDDFDYGLLAQHAKLIVDSRGRYKQRQPYIVNA